jgi:ABC-type phosphate transport system substrate-binding protein
MRKFTKLLTGAVTVGAAALMVAGTVATANADPIGKNGKPVLPAFFDIVGVGSNTTQFVVDQASLDYNNTVTVKQHLAGKGYLYSFDAVGSAKITTKAGCGGTKAIIRPNGSSGGITALTANVLDGKTKHFCIDFARSSRGRSTTDPHLGKGGIAFVPFARDAVTYSTRTAKAGGTDAPANLTTAQLTGIYECTITNWSAVGGKNATIKAFLPQTNSGTRSFFLKTINVTTPGSCVSDGSGATGSIEENEGTNKLLNDAAAIFPFSVGSYVEQAFHSAKCGVKPNKLQNKFGCDAVGVLGLDSINKIAPLAFNKISAKFVASPFGRKLYNVVRFNTATQPIPSALLPIFGPKGYLCTNKVAAKDIANYGFLPVPACGFAT